MPQYRQLTAEEAVVILVVSKNDTPDGLSDDAIQALVGRSPVLEAVDNLHEMTMLSEAIDTRGKPRKRHWRTTAAGEEQLTRQRRNITETLAARIENTKGADEKSRLQELLARLETRTAPAQNTEPAKHKDTTPKAAKKPKPQRRAPKTEEPAQA